MSLQTLEKQATILKALSHPRRLEIIHLIRDQELAVQDIHQMLDLPQANVSQHLSILRESHIVTTRKDGKQHFYSLSDPKIIQANDLIKQFILDTHIHTTNDPETTYTDPICGMTVTAATASFTYTYKNTTHYFCASGCLESFKKNHAK
jgi:ArsR family transcriptional regulator, virulence genes transcriptional regulator